MFHRKFVVPCLLIIANCWQTSAVLSVDSVQERLLGGGTISTGLTPVAISVASVRSKSVQGNFHVCGGFIINKHWVGTAAQCLTYRNVSNTAVSVGARHAINGGIVYDLSRIEKHNYNPITLANDIALLRTATEIVFSANVQPIPLGTLFVGEEPVNIFGWGKTTAGSNFSAALLRAAFTSLSHAECLTRFPFIARRFITERQICSSASSRATCPGDAGGPIFFNDTVVGIVSFVEPCIAGQPNVNTRISFYANWILSFTREDD